MHITPAVRRAVVAVALVLPALVAAACGGEAPSPSPSPAAVIPANPCSVVSAADVVAAVGGSATAGRVNGDGACSFDLSGPVHAAPDGKTPGRIDVSFATEHALAKDQQAVLGDAVNVVDALGTDAWYALGAVHAQVAGGEVVVRAVWFGTVDDAVAQAGVVALTKAILAHL
jgi:hypothetical protein